ncbi:MAG: hypothetical protein RIB84_15140 [Sneathiellaceae bacterium]
MRIAIIATLAYGVALVVIVAALLLTGGAHPHENGMPGALQVLAWCGALLAGGMAPPALAWLVVAAGRLGAALPAAPVAAGEEEDQPADKPATASPEAAKVEDRRDFFSTLERYRTSIYNQFIEVFQDTGLIEPYRAFKFPDGLPMVDRPCIFLVEHFLSLEQKEQPVPERFNMTNEELQILLRMFDEMVSHAKRTNSTFVLRRNDMRVYQMLGGTYP